MNDLSLHLEKTYNHVSRRFAESEVITLDHIKNLIDHDVSCNVIISKVLAYAERISNLDRMLMLAGIKAELTNMIRKGVNDESKKQAYQLLGFEATDFLPGVKAPKEQISISEVCFQSDRGNTPGTNDQSAECSALKEV